MQSYYAHCCFRFLINVDPIDSRLRAVENGFLLGPLLIYARFLSSHSNMDMDFAIFMKFSESLLSLTHSLQIS